ncbi:hypothetical protein PAHAL_7G144300 [Panicum hallii]|uniref:Uncharacterized protein n=1 Tax=Panicum hallii TaxID=206008 RepID=A0A2T8IC97_9POAL|nr:hypothetical protein PAHAL_7G144300 [Panicum hallii]
MTFPPSHSVELTNKKSRKGTSDSGGSIRFKSAGSTNQPEPISIEFPMSRGSNPLRREGKVLKPKIKKQTKEKGKKNDVSFESPAMHTRSKRVDPYSPAMSTRSKRRLNL